MKIQNYCSGLDTSQPDGTNQGQQKEMTKTAQFARK